MGTTRTRVSTISSEPGCRPDAVHPVAVGLLAPLLAAMLAVVPAMIAPVFAHAVGVNDGVVSGGSAEPLPEALTLDLALKLSRDDHPAMAIAAAERMAADADVDLAAAAWGWDSYLEFDARAADKVAVESRD